MQKKDFKFLLLEGVHQNAVNYLNKKGYKNIDYYQKALGEAELIEKIKDAHFIGLRSKTKLNKKVLEKAENLLGIGAFCIGTNQIDLDFAKQKGIPVFNAPFSNTRSVAELVIAEIVMLFRGISEKNMAAHRGEWLKSAENSFEIRGKKLGIIGYGHIGSQVSSLAEAMGLEVYFYDIEDKLIIGNAHQCNDLEELLKIVDVLTLHVPATAETKNMIGKEELDFMKKGSYLINASRGNVVVISELYKKLQNKHLLGAAIDVFPLEPKGKGDEFISELRDIPNVLLTPHIGGSTQEAQQNIALEVAQKLDKYFDIGCTLGAVNFVELSLAQVDISCRRRFFHIHKNVPGVLNDVNNVFSRRGLNIVGQYLKTDSDLGYVIIDIERNGIDDDILNELKKINNTILTRMSE